MRKRGIAAKFGRLAAYCDKYIMLKNRGDIKMRQNFRRLAWRMQPLKHLKRRLKFRNTKINKVTQQLLKNRRSGR